MTIFGRRVDLASGKTPVKHCTFGGEPIVRLAFGSGFSSASLFAVCVCLSVCVLVRQRRLVHSTGERKR